MRPAKVCGKYFQTAFGSVHIGYRFCSRWTVRYEGQLGVRGHRKSGQWLQDYEATGRLNWHNLWNSEKYPPPQLLSLKHERDSVNVQQFAAMLQINYVMLLSSIKHILQPGRLFAQMHGKRTYKAACTVHYCIVFLMMNVRCSKHVENKKNWIKTLIWKVHFVG